jgi:hypothetical protein
MGHSSTGLPGCRKGWRYHGDIMVMEVVDLREPGGKRMLIPQKEKRETE